MKYQIELNDKEMAMAIVALRYVANSVEKTLTKEESDTFYAALAKMEIQYGCTATSTTEQLHELQQPQNNLRATPATELHR